jgi:hypothetical protein
MQKIWLIGTIAMFALACHSSTTQQPAMPAPMLDSTTVQVLDTAYDFGKANEGEKVDFSFHFRNTGTKPLVIVNAVASCGCTKPTWPKEPIPPGAIGIVKAEFNTEGRVGPAHKVITVTSNARPNFPPLKLTGLVIKKSS